MKVRMIKTVSVYQGMMVNKEMSGEEQYRAFADDEYANRMATNFVVTQKVQQKRGNLQLGFHAESN